MTHARFATSAFIVWALCGCTVEAGIGTDSSNHTEACSIAATTCDGGEPDVGEAGSWRHPIWNLLSRVPKHRGHDLILSPEDPQVVMARFVYGAFSGDPHDDDLEDEDVDVYLLRGCGSEWEHLGSGRTSSDDAVSPVEGYPDDGGHLFFEIPDAQRLAVGRHRIRLVVRGDLSSVDLFIEVLPPSTKTFISDVDGTLTDYELAELLKLPLGTQPGVHDDAAAAFEILASKGYRPIYLTARPESLLARTRTLLDDQGFPAGIVHTTLSSTGYFGQAATDFKSGELGALEARGLRPTFAFGNTATDAAAYADAGVAERIFYRFDDDRGGRRIDAYGELLDELEALPSACGPSDP